MEKFTRIFVILLAFILVITTPYVSLSFVEAQNSIEDSVDDKDELNSSDDSEVQNDTKEENLNKSFESQREEESNEVKKEETLQEEIQQSEKAVLDEKQTSADESETDIKISTAKELYDIRNNLEANYILVNDIDLSGYENWEPIQDFAGTLDGNNHKIKNLNIENKNLSETSYIGLFGTVKDAEIKNIILDNLNIDIYISDDLTEDIYLYMGGILATGGKTIKNCSINGNIKVDSNLNLNNQYKTGICVGGICGGSGNKIIDCTNNSSINIKATTNGGHVGGIKGDGSAEVTNCTNTGEVTAYVKRPISVGGITGGNGYIYNCINTGNINGRIKGSDCYGYTEFVCNVGGICGFGHNTVANCINKGNVKGATDFSFSRYGNGCEVSVGGIAGRYGFLCEPNIFGSGKSSPGKLYNNYNISKNVVATKIKDNKTEYGPAGRIIGSGWIVDENRQTPSNYSWKATRVNTSYINTDSTENGITKTIDEIEALSGCDLKSLPGDEILDIDTVKDILYIKKGSYKSISASIYSYSDLSNEDIIFTVEPEDNSIISTDTIVDKNYLISDLKGLELGETSLIIKANRFDSNSENNIGDCLAETEVKVVVNETGDADRQPDTDKTIATMEILNSVTVPYGTKFSDLNLPTSTNVTLVDGTKTKANIKWDESTYTSSSGAKRVKGTFVSSNTYNNNREYEPIILVNVMKSLNPTESSSGENPNTTTIKKGETKTENKVKLKDKDLVINGTYICDSLKICDGSILRMGKGGRLIVKGDLVIESDGAMDMSADCRVQVKNFNIKSEYKYLNNFIAGDLYIEDDFKQSGSPRNFEAGGTHSVIFVGKRTHSISSRNNGFVFNNLYIEPSSSGAPLSNFDSLQKLNTKNVLGEFKTVSTSGDEYGYSTYTKKTNIEKNESIELSKDKWLNDVLNVYQKYGLNYAMAATITNRLTKEENDLILKEATVWAGTISSPLYKELLDAGKNTATEEFKLKTEKEGTITVKLEADIYGYGSYGSVSNIKCTIKNLNVNDFIIGMGAGTSNDNFIKQVSIFLTEESKKYFVACTTNSSDPLDVEKMVKKKIKDKLVNSFIDVINRNILYSNTEKTTQRITDVKTTVNAVSGLLTASSSPKSIESSTEKEMTVRIPGKEDEEFSDENFVKAVKKSLGIDEYINLNEDILSEVEYLDLSSSNIDNISGIEHCKNLKYLDISANNIYNLYYIKDLKNLKYLNVSDNDVQSTYHLGNLTNLTSLNMKSNKVRDFSYLENLTNLEEFILSGNDLSMTNISDLSKLTNLKIFEARECGLTDIQIPTDNLIQLDLSDNEIEDISALEKASKLTTLFISNNYISDITAIKNCSNLNVLDLSYNIIDSIEPIENLKSLEQLDLEFCYLMNYELDSIAKLENLKEINLSRNHIYDIKTLASLAKLTKLNLSYTEVTDVSSLSNNVKVINDKYENEQKELPVIKIGETTNSTNLRTGPSTDYSSIGKLASGEIVRIVGVDSATGWYKIKYGNRYAYISYKYVKLNEESLPVIKTGVTTNSMNVRKGTSTSYSILGKLSSGAKVEIVEVDSATGWYKIKYNNDYAYISYKYVKIDAEELPVIKTGVTTNSMNVRKGPSTSYSIVGKLSNGAKVEIVEVDKSTGWYKIKYGSGYAYISYKYVKIDGEELPVIKTGVTTNSMNVRKGPSTSYSSIGKLASGTKVEIVEVDSKTGWYKIKYKDGYAYISYKYVKIDLPVIKTGVTTNSMNVRKGPSTSYSIIGKLSSGTKVEIVKVDSKTGWYQIKYGSGHGYISYKYVKIN